MRSWLVALTFRELVERYHHYQDEPFGYDIDNFRAALTPHTLAQVHGNKTKLSDFYPSTQPNVEPSEDEVADKILTFFRR